MFKLFNRNYLFLNTTQKPIHHLINTTKVSHSNLQRTFATIARNANEVKLNNLRDNPGARKKRKIVGRGVGSGRGKTSGKGHKGQNARAGGGVRPGFEGGQTPFYKRVRKYGFHNQFTVKYNSINLDQLQTAIDQGKIDTSQVITIRTLRDAGLVKRVRHGIKILGRGADSFNKQVNLEVSQISASARKSIEAQGGNVKTVYFNRLGLYWFLRKDHDSIPIKFARAPRRMEDRFDIPQYELPQRGT